VLPCAFEMVERRRSILDAWLAEHAEGIACVIGSNGIEDGTFEATPRVRLLTPELSKGLEFDLVVPVDPALFGRSPLAPTWVGPQCRLSIIRAWRSIARLVGVQSFQAMDDPSCAVTHPRYQPVGEESESASFEWPGP